MDTKWPYAPFHYFTQFAETSLVFPQNKSSGYFSVYNSSCVEAT